MAAIINFLNRVVIISITAVFLINWKRAKVGAFSKGIKTRLSGILLLIIVPIGLFNAGLLYFSHTIFDWLRVISVTLFLIELCCIKEGFTEEGVIHEGTICSYSDVRCYDSYEEKNAFKVLVGIPEKDKKTSHLNINYSLMTFDIKEKDVIQQLLKEKLPRKWQRLKKG